MNEILRNTKVWIGDNPPLKEALLKRVAEFGFSVPKAWDELSPAGKTRINCFYFNEDDTVSCGTDRGLFYNQIYKEISPAQVLLPERWSVKTDINTKPRFINMLIVMNLWHGKARTGEEYMKEYHGQENPRWVCSMGGSFPKARFYGIFFSDSLISFQKFEEIYNLVTGKSKNTMENKTLSNIQSRFPEQFSVGTGNPDRGRLIANMLGAAGWENHPFLLDDKYHVCILGGRVDGITSPLKYHFSFDEFVSIYHGFSEYKKIPTLPTVNGHEGKLEGGILKYGSADIDVRLIRAIYNAMTPLDGNCKVAHVTLDSGFRFNAEQINQISEYIDDTIPF